MRRLFARARAASTGSVLWIVLVSGFAGCGLDRAGLGPATLGDDASPSVDSGAGSENDGAANFDVGGSSGQGPTDDGEPPAACAPAGWSLVLYGPSSSACPSGYASHAEVTGATAGSGACTCPCTVTAEPTCDQGTVSTQYATGLFAPNVQCGSAGLPLQVNGGGCTSMGGQGGKLADGFSAEPLQAGGGACNAQLAADPSQVTKNDVLVCDVPAAQAGAMCSGSPPASFSLCIVAPGDVACPAGAFTKQSLVADDEVLVCPSCGACQVSGSCKNAQVEFFGDAACKTSVATLGANGDCVSTGLASGQNVVAFEYGVEAEASCQASLAGTPSFDPVQPQTLCCR